ncbi:single-stranded-DNA-specific exonuclease RecJ [Zooshikella sp. RANM57]|uniref:single-stranded-DNA-specific exonuclease RecJ n=1 Tax=Zooshikella sp. RANM57 TaxID=3425863 RepID=UPI003D6EB15D
MQKKINTRHYDAQQLKFGHEIPPLLQRIYAARGVYSNADLSRSLQGLMSFTSLKGLDQAVNILCEALEKQSRVLIVGDFDADGATSTALAVLLLRAMGVLNVNYLVPNRFAYGYGLSPEIVEEAKQYEPDLIITVDNGISSISGVAAAKAAGIQVLVTDHHLAGAELPMADAIVNPNQPGCHFAGKNTAGVGVIYYVLMALRSALRARGWFNDNRPEPNLAHYLDIVALGTVADVVPLDTNNRLLVYQGLRRMRAGKARPGINALLEVAGRKTHRLTAADLGFALGPRLNAAGRLDDMSLGIECLLTDDPYLAREIALQLDDLNRDRKQIEADMQQQALAALDAIKLDDSQNLPVGICLYDENWHQGVIGILASRIKDRLHRPVIAFAAADGNEVKGSARSIPGFHIRDALDAIASQHSGLLSKFGGHAMAAGLSLPAAHLPDFKKAFDDIARQWLSDEDLEAELHTDGVLQPEEFSLQTATMLREAGPWGQHFPEPSFYGEFLIIQQRLVGQKHLKLVLMLPGTERYIDGIAFNVDLSCWPNLNVQQVRVVYQLDLNEYKGQQNIQLLINYLEPVVNT